VNHKRVWRPYREAGLAVRRRRRRSGVAVEREPLALPTAPNQVWSMDFVMDALSSGRRVKCLTIVDDFTKEAVDIVPDHSIPGLYVKRVLDQAARFRGLPAAIRTDQGPEFTGRALDQWAYRNGVQLKLIAPGSPTQNAFIESFNGKFRDECPTTIGSRPCTLPAPSLPPGGATTTSIDRTARLAIAPRPSSPPRIAITLMRNPTEDIHRFSTTDFANMPAALRLGAGQG